MDAEPGLRGSEGCEVLSWIDGELLSFSWSAPPSFGHLRARRSFVVVRLRDQDGDRATEARCTAAGLPTAATRKVRDTHFYCHLVSLYVLLYCRCYLEVSL